MPKRKRKLIKF